MGYEERYTGGWGEHLLFVSNYVVYTIVISCVVTADIDTVRGKGARLLHYKGLITPE